MILEMTNNVELRFWSLELYFKNKLDAQENLPLSKNQVTHCTYLRIKHHSRFFECLAHPNLSATLATDKK
jgi:hypothetical protein